MTFQSCRSSHGPRETFNLQFQAHYFNVSPVNLKQRQRNPLRMIRTHPSPTFLRYRLRIILLYFSERTLYVDKKKGNETHLYSNLELSSTKYILFPLLQTFSIHAPSPFLSFFYTQIYFYCNLISTLQEPKKHENLIKLMQRTFIFYHFHV